MNHLPTGLLIASALTTAFVLGALPIAGAQATSADAIDFGMDASSVAAQKAAGAAPDYGTFWIGPWTLSSGWGAPDSQLASLRAAGVTPAVHFYYWGDDISPSCVENGCWSSLHDAQKTRAGWEKLGTQLTDHLNSKMGGEPVVVFLESEFNKGGIQTYEPFDGYMAAMAGKIHAAYPNAIVVLGFGNWGSQYWGNFDRAAAASDMVGIQGMRGSTKQDVEGMKNLYEGLLAGVKTLETKFPGKDIMLTDIAVSSYPDSTHLAVQADVLREVLDNLPTLKAHGVEAIVYRSWRDSPNMDLANYYGQAERHWGLAYPDNAPKPAAKVWVEAVKAERSGSAPANGAPAAAFAATASGLVVNVDGAASADPDGDALTYTWSFGDGATASGRTASHAYAAAGTYTLRLTVSDGQLSASASKSVTVSKPASTTTSTSSTSATSTSSTYKATVTPSPNSNEWWVQVGVSPAPAKVEVKAGSGSYVALTKESYGYAESLHVPKGTMVQFRVTSAGGQTATTPAQAWLVDMSAKTATSGTSGTTGTSAFKATFTPKAVGNDWWVEAAVSGNAPIAKVEAKVGGGAYTVLPKTDWGTYAKSMHVPGGSIVTFRATSTSGATSTSAGVAWT